MTSDPSALVCREVVELITEYLSGALAPDDRVRLEQHLLVCPPCTAHLAQVRQTLRWVETLAEPASPSPVPADLLEQFRARRKG